jgi:hypothetical protein
MAGRWLEDKRTGVREYVASQAVGDMEFKEPRKISDDAWEDIRLSRYEALAGSRSTCSRP